MKRRLLNFLTTGSLLLCAALVVLAVARPSSTRAYAFRCGNWSGCFGFDTRGVVVGYRRAPAAGDAAAAPLRWDWPGAMPDDAALAATGFATGTVNVAREVPGLSGVPFVGRLFQSPTPARYVKAPWWPLALLAASPPALAALRASTCRRRRKSGRCPGCGYDLTANVSGVCPECGGAGRCD
jgi:hypothetical protein